MRSRVCQLFGYTVLACFAAALALAALSSSQAGVAPVSGTPTSITLQELEPGICEPVMFEAKGAGYTGAGYINSPNNKAARITWSVKSPAGGPHTLEIRFSNGAKLARPGLLEVNGGANGKFDVALSPTGSFAQWQTTTLNIELIAGENTIALQAITDEGLANIDYLKVTGANPAPGHCGEPEPAAGPVVLHDVKNVRLVHNTFINGSHDLLVISGTSDFVTISWNVFRQTIFGHDHKGVNIGASDKDTTSRGYLRVTLHHNFYAKLINERMPRVGFGQVHTFNNLCLAGTGAR